METLLVSTYVLIMSFVYVAMSLGIIYYVSLKMKLTGKPIDEDIASINVNEIINKLSYSKMVNIPFVNIMVLVPFNLFYVVGFIITFLYVYLSTLLFNFIFY